MFQGSYRNPVAFKGQKYKKLAKVCEIRKELFTDPEFPPEEKSLFYPGSSRAGQLTGVEWKRPRDICESPRLVQKKKAAITQGQLGNCWFVAACCCAQQKNILHKVIPNLRSQEWDERKPGRYCGLFHFRFWRYGQWVDVVVDDLLPIKNGRLVFIRSKEGDEFWGPLLEKAYAKLFGCYEALVGGELAEALEDFTGGVAEPIELADKEVHARARGQGQNENEEEATDDSWPDDLFRVMRKEAKRDTLMSAAIHARTTYEIEQVTDLGLVKGHAYQITGVLKLPVRKTGLEISYGDIKLKMIRLRNPWGRIEWEGSFSEQSEEWAKLTAAQRKSRGLVIKEEGEFWLLFTDYCRFFSAMTICRSARSGCCSSWRWHELHGQWHSQGRNGGCGKNKDTFLCNPQYLLDVSKEEELLLTVTQKSGRGAAENNNKHSIGMSLMKVEENREYRVHQMHKVVTSTIYKNSRSVFLRQSLKRGRYAVIPSTYDKGKHGPFMLRVFSPKCSRPREVIKDWPKRRSKWQQRFCGCVPCFRPPECLTTIRVIRASSLFTDQDKTGDFYCKILCEKEVIQSGVDKEVKEPNWDTEAIFYQRRPIKDPLRVEVWQKRRWRCDLFRGEHRFPYTGEQDKKLHFVDLMNKNSSKKMENGRLFVEISCSKYLYTPL